MLCQTVNSQVPVAYHPTLLPMLSPMHLCSAGSRSSCDCFSISDSASVQGQQSNQHRSNSARARPKQLCGNSFARESWHGHGTLKDLEDKAWWDPLWSEPNPFLSNGICRAWPYYTHRTLSTHKLNKAIQPGNFIAWCIGNDPQIVDLWPEADASACIYIYIYIYIYT